MPAQAPDAAVLVGTAVLEVVGFTVVGVTVVVDFVLVGAVVLEGAVVDVTGVDVGTALPCPMLLRILSNVLSG